MNKPKVIKDFTKLPEELQDEILEQYPQGYQDALILFTDRDGKYAHALPYETEDRYYLLRMPQVKSKKSVIDSDDDDIADDDDSEENTSNGYTDLDTMQIGGGRKNDEEEGYD